MKSTLLKLALAAAATACAGAPTLAEEPDAGDVAAATLRELAAAADLIAVVQVADTDYQYTRGFPSGGTAFLRILIPYKVSRPLPDLVEVYEEGLRDHECYFPNPTVFEEGRRYLVFLRFSAEVEAQYNGLPQGCALEALVTAENRYALRYPLNGVALADDYHEAAEEMSFADAYASLEEDDITPDLRNEWLNDGWLLRRDEGYRYTHGIPLGVARALLGEENLTLDRSLR